jgi:hypothetical protein
MMRKVVAAPALLATAVIGGYIWQRPRLLHWGATAAEAARPLPGDEFVPDPKSVTTRAINIEAPVTAVWPWLLQIGQGRGGFYSYDWLENLMGLEIHTAREIRPELQGLQEGDLIRLTPPEMEEALNFQVAILRPFRALVLRTAGEREETLAAGFPYATWAFLLEVLEPNRTRLIVRLRADFKQDLAGFFLNQVMVEPAHFIMERKMMLTFKELAEGKGTRIDAV